MPIKKNLILGTIANYDFEVLRPFLMTLRKTGYAGDIVFFYSNISEKTLQKLKGFGVALVPFSTVFPYLDATFSKHIVWPSNGRRITSLKVHSLRFLLEYCYLTEYGDKYIYVMHTDTRDVIFQKDPFEFPIDKHLCCFTENEKMSIGDSEINARWIRTDFGDEMLVDLADKPIVCSGVTIGPVEAMLHYLQIFIDTMVKYDVPKLVGSIEADQSVHNYIIHRNLVPDLMLYKNNAGPVLTLALEDRVYLTSDGLIRNQQGEIPAVVHQYDRHWHIAKRYWSLRFIWRMRIAYVRGKLAQVMCLHAPALYRAFMSVRLAFRNFISKR